MPIEAVKIPQNVYVEDRIIGPVTLRQLVITGVGAGISYVLYAMAAKAGATVPFLVACWTPAIIGGAFAFMKVNDLSLFNIILLVIEGMQKPSQRYWSSYGGISINLITRTIAKEMNDAASKVAQDQDKLVEITRQLEKRQEAMDRVAMHEMPRPEAVDGIQTKFASAINPDSVPAEDAAQNTKPVDPKRIDSGGLDPAKSIDGVAADLQAFDRLMSRVS